MNKKLFLLLAAIFTSIFVNAQISYDFEDGTINGWTQSVYGHWDASSYEAINGIFSLHHIYDNPDNGNDAISLIQNVNPSEGTIIWKFKIRHGYYPSSSNNWAVILLSDKNSEYFNADSSIYGYGIGVDLYTESDDQLTFYRFDGLKTTDLIKFPFNWQEEIGTNPAGLVITRSAQGYWQFFISKNLNYDSLLYLGSIIDTSYTNGQYFGIYYEYSSSQDQKLWFDDLKIYYPANSQTGTIKIAKITDTISSTNTSSPGKPVFKITIKDTDQDTLPTYIKSITIIKGDSNQVKDWYKAIAGGFLYLNGITYPAYITENAITFPVNITVPDGDSITCTGYLWFTTQPNIITDNSKFDFKLASSNITVLPNGSGFSDLTTVTGSIVYSVQADRIKFDNVPLTVKPNTQFSITIKATDIYGNIDVDANQKITLSLSSGAGILNSQSGLSKNLSSGIINWDDLSYSDYGYFSIYAYSETFGLTESPQILSNSYIYYLLDDFEDGKIDDWLQSYAGHWIASSDEPIQGSYSLREVFDNASSAIEWISHKLTAVKFDTTKIWRFSIKYDYPTPSSSNNWNIVLFSDLNPGISDTISGYCLGINWNSTNDLLTLYRIDKGQPQSILTTNINWQDNIPTGKIVDFQISRTQNGIWTILMDTVPGEFDNLVFLGKTYDTTYQQANFFSVRYQYTSSGDKKLTLDNFYFGDPIPDTLPPHIDTVIAVSPLRLKIYFNEPIADNFSFKNFLINDTNPIDAQLNSDNPKLIDITLNDSLKENQLYQLTVKDISDLAGNILDSSSTFFSWENFKILSYYFLSYNSIKITFNRQPNSFFVLDTSGYHLIPSAGGISDIQLNNNSITLTFSQNLVQNQSYTLTLDSIRDVYGNLLINNQIHFLFYIANPFDIVFNEILFDVSPEPAALPPYKYIEIYNRTNIDIDLTGWTLQIGTSPQWKIENITLPAHGYAIFCSEEAAKSLENFGITIPILNDYYLTTTGKELILRNNTGKIIDDITYSTLWYHDDTKDNGGWSVERIDPNNFCNQENNWHVTDNPIGGTPDFKNSVFGTNQDTTKPEIVSIIATSSKTLTIQFNKPVSPNSAENPLNYIINSEATPLKATINETNPRAVDLIFVVSFNNGTNKLKVKNIEDFCANIINDTTVTFSYQQIYPTAVEPINETQLKLYFSEPVEKSSSQTTSHYTILETQTNPTYALRDQYDPRIVHLIFNKQLNQDSIYHLQIDSIADLNGNICSTDTLQFAIHTPKKGDIVFNEFMADVSPEPQGLPAAKYIELYNTTRFDIWLNSWILQVPSGKTYSFPTYLLRSHQYLVLTDQDNQEQFSNSLGLISQTEITNTGTYKLTDPNNNIIDYVMISPDYYDDPTKSQGGWSLEKINPVINCQSDTLWTASISPKGGTPGYENSVYDPQFFTENAQLITFKVRNAKELYLKFDQPITNASALQPENYQINNNAVTKVSTDNYFEFDIQLNSQLIDNETYNLKINMYDDCDNQVLINKQFTYHKVHLLRLIPIDTNILRLEFSEEISDTSAYIKLNYKLNDTAIPQFIAKDAQNPNIIFIQFANRFQNGQNKLTIENLTDVLGNVIMPASYNFTYYIPNNTDVIINEILFNPYPNCARFIEIYNKTNYPIYLHNLFIANLNLDTVPENIVQLSTNDTSVILPKSYLAITTDTLNIINTYPVHGKNFIQTKSLPKLYDDQGNIALLTLNKKIIDYFYYNENMHNALITNPEGVSLERIDFNRPTNSAENWASASQTVNYATPAAENSQHRNLDSLFSGQITISPNVFSPDDDGYDDYLFINITTEQPNTYSDILITDKYGTIVKHLISNYLLSQTQTFKWDGSDDTGKILNRGFYIVIVKLYTPDGMVKTYRKTIAIAKKY